MNLAALLSQSASRLADKPALYVRGKPLTYGDLDDRVARASAGLVHLGLSTGAGSGPRSEDPGPLPGDRVALMVGNSPHFVEAFFAILRAGLVAVPLNVGFTRHEASHILADSRARAVIVAEPFVPWSPGWTPRCPDSSTWSWRARRALPTGW